MVRGVVVLVGEPVAPVGGQQVVQDVVDGDRAQQVPRGVDDGAGHQVVRREVAGDPGQRLVGGHRLQLRVEDAGHQLERSLPQQPLGVRAAQVAAGRRLRRRAADEHHAGQCRRDVRVADVGQRLGHGGVGPQDERLGRHEAARGVRGVPQQPPDRLGLLGLHQGQQRCRLVGEPLVVEGVDDLVAALRRQRREGAGDVGGPHRVEHREQPLGALPVGQREPGHRPPRHAPHLGAPGEPPAAGPHGEPADHPVAGTGGLDGGVDDDDLVARLGRLARVLHPHDGVEQLPDHQRLARASGELPQAHRPGRERDRARVDGGDPQHRHEDPASGGDLDDEAEHARRAVVDPQRRDHVAHLADAFAVGPEHGEPHHARGEDPGYHDPERSPAMRR